MSERVRPLLQPSRYQLQQIRAVCRYRSSRFIHKLTPRGNAAWQHKKTYKNTLSSDTICVPQLLAERLYLTLSQLWTSQMAAAGWQEKPAKSFVERRNRIHTKGVLASTRGKYVFMTEICHTESYNWCSVDVSVSLLHFTSTGWPSRSGLRLSVLQVQPCGVELELQGQPGATYLVQNATNLNASA